MTFNVYKQGYRCCFSRLATGTTGKPLLIRGARQVGKSTAIRHLAGQFDHFLEINFEEQRQVHKIFEGDLNPHDLPDIIHQKLVQHFKRFLMLGGMPEVIATYAEHKDLIRCGQVLDDLTSSLKADFAKYKKHVPFLRIAEVFDSVVNQSGGKFMYSKAAIESSHRQIKEAIDLLSMAGLIIPVTHTAANGLPLGAETNRSVRKMLLLDTGIFQRLLQLNMGELLTETDFDLINKGSIAEQYVGLELLKAASSYRQEELFYWHREAKSSNAEVDYVVQKSEDIIPIEVKSGKKGSMRSITIFMEEKKSPYGIRCSIENFAEINNIHIIPIYAIGDWYAGK